MYVIKSMASTPQEKLIRRKNKMSFAYALPPTPTFNEDEWGEVINGPDTFRAIAIGLLNCGSVAIGWTDQHSTHYDLVFSFGYLKHGTLQGGLNTGKNLMVAIVRKGCFGFDVASKSDLHYSYVGENLDVPSAETSFALANLIMGVRKILSGS
jgi:hypothetical protein